MGGGFNRSSRWDGVTSIRVGGLRRWEGENLLSGVLAIGEEEKMGGGKRVGQNFCPRD